MGRAPSCSKLGLNRGAWTADEDNLLLKYFETHSELGGWKSVPKKAGLRRSGKSCRLRWLNYLRPNIKRGNISPEEEDLIVRLHGLLGNRWSLIAGRVPGRTDNEIKNYWNTTLSKKLALQGIDPKTHKPFMDMNILPHKYANCKQLQLNTRATELLQHRPSFPMQKNLQSLSVVESDTDAESCSLTEQIPAVSTELSLSYNPGPHGFLSHLMNTQSDDRAPQADSVRFSNTYLCIAPSNAMFKGDYQRRNEAENDVCCSTA